MRRIRHLRATALAVLLAVAASVAAAEGRPLKVGVYELPGIVSLEEGRPVGVAIDFWREIADRLGLGASGTLRHDRSRRNQAPGPDPLFEPGNPNSRSRV